MSADNEMDRLLAGLGFPIDADEALSGQKANERRPSTGIDAEGLDQRIALLEDFLVSNHVIQVDLAKLEGNPTGRSVVLACKEPYPLATARSMLQRLGPDRVRLSSARTSTFTVALLTMASAAAGTVLILAEALTKAPVRLILPAGMSTFGSVTGIGAFLAYRAFHLK